MTDLDARAEHLKFARLVDAADGDLAFLEAMDPDVVRPVRQRVSDLLFAQGEGHFDRLLAASRLLPDPLTAWIAQQVFPPLVCAQVSGRLSPHRAAALIRHVDPVFLAEMAAVTDPTTIEHLVPALPTDVVVATAVEMNRRRDHLASGRLVGLAPDAMIPRLLDAIDDDADLLEIAFYMERRERLDAIVRHVDADRLATVLEVARERDQWPQALVLTSHLSPEQTARVAGIMAEAPEATVTSLLAAVQREGLWTALLPLLEHMSDDDMARVADNAVLVRPEVLVDVLDAADAVDRWEVVVRVVLAMGPTTQEAVARALPELDAATVARLRAAVERVGRRDGLGPVADRVPPASG